MSTGEHSQDVCFDYTVCLFLSLNGRLDDFFSPNFFPPLELVLLEIEVTFLSMWKQLKRKSVIPKFQPISPVILHLLKKTRTGFIVKVGKLFLPNSVLFDYQRETVNLLSFLSLQNRLLLQ